MGKAYTKNLVQELISARICLLAAGEDCSNERRHLDLAEEALLAEGWQNTESADQLADIAGLSGAERAAYLAAEKRLTEGLRD